MKGIIRIALLVCCLFLVGAAGAQINPVPVKKAQNVVLFGIYPTAIYNFDFKNGTFKITFYAWWRTKDRNYNPEKSLEIINAADFRLANVTKGQNSQEYYSNARIFATIHQQWDITKFPFDKQHLTILFEDADYTQDLVLFKPDLHNSAMDRELFKEGWVITGFNLFSRPNFYQTNFGDISQKSASNIYSQFVVTLTMKRLGWRPFFSYFIGFFTAVFLCVMVFFVATEKLTAQAGFMLGAVFSAVGNKYVVDQLLPSVDEFTLLDVVELCTFLMIAATYLTSLILVLLYDKLGPKKFKILHYVFGLILLITYLTIVGIFTYKAQIS